MSSDGQTAGQCHKMYTEQYNINVRESLHTSNSRWNKGIASPF